MDFANYVDDAMQAGTHPIYIVRNLTATYKDMTWDQLVGLVPRFLRYADLNEGIVANAAYIAWLLLAAKPDTPPVTVGQAVQQYFELTAVEMAQVMKFGEPYPVFPDMQASTLADTLYGLHYTAANDVALALHSDGVFPDLTAEQLGRALLGSSSFATLTRDQMQAALNAAGGYTSAQISSALTALYPSSTALPAPTVQQTMQGGKLQISWSQVTGASGYTLQVLDTAFGGTVLASRTLAATAQSLTLASSDLTPKNDAGGIVQAQVKALGGSGHTDSPYAAAAGTTAYMPAAGSLQLAYDPTQNQLTASWVPRSDTADHQAQLVDQSGTGYLYQEYLKAGTKSANFANIGRFVQSTGPFTINVYSLESDGNALPGNAAGPAAALPALPAPAGLTLTPSGTGSQASYAVSWSAAAGAAGYWVFVWNETNGYAAMSKQAGTDCRATLNVGSLPAGSYTIRVQAIGDSAHINSAYAKSAAFALPRSS